MKIRWMAWAVCGLCLSSAAWLAPDAAWGDELYTADLQGELWSYGTETESRTRIGRLPAALVGLDVSADGSLIGIADDRRIWRIDPTNGRSTLLQPGVETTTFRYADVLELAPNDLLLVRRDEVRQWVELTRLDLTTGTEQVLGTVDHNLDTLPQPLDFSSVMMSGDEIFLLTLERVLRLNLADMTAFEILEWQVTASDFDAGGLNFWVLADFADGESGLRLLARQGFGEPATDRPVYDFPVGLGPRAIAYRADDSSCPANSRTLCLRDGRFQLQVEWRDFEDRMGLGEAVVDRSRSAGQFWFFTPDNRELMVKVLDGCALNQRHWVFVSGTTNVEVMMTVTDLATGAVKQYQNELGDVFETRLDTEAFGGCSPLLQALGGVQ